MNTMNSQSTKLHKITNDLIGDKMFSTLQRFKADSTKEKIYGLLFYVFLFSSIGLAVFTVAYWEELSNVALWYIAATYAFLVTTIPAFASYGNYKNCHAGTVTQYIMKLNPPRPSFMHLLRIWDKKDGAALSAVMFCIFTAVMTIIFVIASVDKKEIGYFLFAVYNLSLIVISYYISYYGLYKSKVSKELLTEFYDIETVNTADKENFKLNIIRILESKGFVVKKDVFGLCKYYIKNECKRKTEIETKIKTGVHQKEYAGFADIPVSKSQS